MPATKIEWCDHSINPIRSGRTDGTHHKLGHYCEKISPGCANCYASSLQRRFGMPTFPGVSAEAEPTSELVVSFDEAKLQEVIRRKTPTWYFWCDMTDMFGEWVIHKWQRAIWDTMVATDWHMHLVLTKRPERMRDFVVDGRGAEKNIWLGVSAENEKYFKQRVDVLLKIPAAKRFASCEPLLGSIDARWALGGDEPMLPIPNSPKWARGIEWVIIGGESGRSQCRVCRMSHVLSLINQCRDAGVACFNKQLGSRPVRDDGTLYPLDHPKGGDPDEWPAEYRVRQRPEAFT